MCVCVCVCVYKIHFKSHNHSRVFFFNWAILPVLLLAHSDKFLNGSLIEINLLMPHK